MANEQTHDVQTTSKREPATLEGTRPGPVDSPAVDIFEDADAITILADMPGVERDALRIDLNEGVLTMTGEAAQTRGETEADVVTEFLPGRFLRRFALSERIDQSKIEATLTDGVLRLVLPKAEATKPRRIEVKTN